MPRRPPRPSPAHSWVSVYSESEWCKATGRYVTTVDVGYWYAGPVAFAHNAHQTDQAAFRWREDVTGVSWLAVENASLDVVEGDVARLRVALDETGTDTSDKAPHSFVLQYEINNSGTWVDVAASGTSAADIRFYNTAFNGADATKRLTWTGTLIDGQILESDPYTDSTNDWTASNGFEFEWALEFHNGSSGLSNNDSIRFRVLHEGAVLDAYTNYGAATFKVVTQGVISESATISDAVNVGLTELLTDSADLSQPRQAIYLEFNTGTARRLSADDWTKDQAGDYTDWIGDHTVGDGLFYRLVFGGNPAYDSKAVPAGGTPDWQNGEDFDLHFKVRIGDIDETQRPEIWIYLWAVNGQPPTAPPFRLIFEDQSTDTGNNQLRVQLFAPSIDYSAAVVTEATEYGLRIKYRNNADSPMTYTVTLELDGVEIGSGTWQPNLYTWGTSMVLRGEGSSSQTDPELLLQQVRANFYGRAGAFVGLATLAGQFTGNITASASVADVLATVLSQIGRIAENADVADRAAFGLDGTGYTGDESPPVYLEDVGGADGAVLTSLRTDAVQLKTIGQKQGMSNQYTSGEEWLTEGASESRPSHDDNFSLYWRCHNVVNKQDESNKEDEIRVEMHDSTISGANFLRFFFTQGYGVGLDPFFRVGMQAYSESPSSLQSDFTSSQQRPSPWSRDIRCDWEIDGSGHGRLYVYEDGTLLDTLGPITNLADLGTGGINRFRWIFDRDYTSEDAGLTEFLLVTSGKGKKGWTAVVEYDIATAVLGALTEAASVTGTFSAAVTAAVAVTDAAVAAGTMTAQAAVDAILAEAAAGSDLWECSRVIIATIAEAGQVADTYASTASAQVAVSDSAQVNESKAAAAQVLAAMVDAAIADGVLTAAAAADVILAETATGADLWAAGQAVLALIAESGAGTDAYAAILAAGAAVTESGQGTDTMSGAAQAQAAISDAPTIADVINGQAQVIAQLAQGATVTEVLAGGQLVVQLLAEIGEVGDTYSPVASALGILPESANVTPVMAAVAVALTSIESAAVANEQTAALAVASAAVSEGGIAADVAGSAAAAARALSETATGNDLVDYLVTALGALQESAQSGDTWATITQMLGQLIESAQATDTWAGAASGFEEAFLTETATAADTWAPILQRLAQLADTGQAQGLFVGLASVLEAIAEAGSITDAWEAIQIRLGFTSDAATVADQLTATATALGSLTGNATAADLWEGTAQGLVTGIIVESASAADVFTGAAAAISSRVDGATVTDALLGIILTAQAVADQATLTDSWAAQVGTRLGELAESAQLTGAYTVAAQTVQALADTINADALYSATGLAQAYWIATAVASDLWDTGDTAGIILGAITLQAAVAASITVTAALKEREISTVPTVGGDPVIN